MTEQTPLGSPYPLRHSDIDCPVCHKWFRFAGDLHAHLDRVKAEHD